MKILFRTMTLISLLFAGIAYAGANTEFDTDTLGANKVLPNNLIEKLLDETVASSLLSTPYTGFYQINGTVTNNKLNFNKVKNAFPDARLEQLALGLAGMMEIPVYSTGSRIKTRATAYVVFFKDSLQELELENVMRIPTSVDGEPNTLAMVIIKQKEISNARNPNMRLANAEIGKRDGTEAYFFEMAI
jgi:hypothetical protein